MTPDRARELLGGLAAGILTPEERHVLFEAALHDQELFNEVADELEFAAFLQSPETRAQLANRIEVEPEQKPRWWAMRPAWMALTGVLAASAVLFVAVWHRNGEVVDNISPSVKKEAPATPPAHQVARQQPPAQPAKPQETTKQVKAKPAPEKPVGNPQEVADGLAEKKQEVASAEKQVRSEEPPVNKQMAAGQRFGTRAGGGGASGPDRLPVEQNAAPGAAGMPQGEARLHSGPVPPAATLPPVPLAAPPVPPPPPPAERPAAPAPIASIEGTVHDPAGFAVPNAGVDIVNRATGSAVHTTTDSSGKFVATLVPGGPYTVIATATGFKRQERNGITVETNQPARVDLPLDVGQMGESVMVTAAAPIVSGSVATAISANKAGFLNSASQIAVLDFTNRTGESQSGQQAADFLSNQLLDSGQVRVIGRKKVQQAQQALALSQSKARAERAPSTKEAADLGRRIGADAVIVGTVQPAALSRDKDVTRGSANIALTAQVIDTRNRRPMPQVSANGSSLQGAANRLGLELQSQLAVPLEGQVTGVNAGLVSANFDRPPRIGARLEVYRGTRRIGELTLTSAYGQIGYGKYSGEGQPRRGDRVTSPR